MGTTAMWVRATFTSPTTMSRPCPFVSSSTIALSSLSDPRTTLLVETEILVKAVPDSEVIPAQEKGA